MISAVLDDSPSDTSLPLKRTQRKDPVLPRQLFLKILESLDWACRSCGVPACSSCGVPAKPTSHEDDYLLAARADLSLCFLLHVRPHERMNVRRQLHVVSIKPHTRSSPSPSELGALRSQAHATAFLSGRYSAGLLELPAQSKA